MATYDPGKPMLLVNFMAPGPKPTNRTPTLSAANKQQHWKHQRASSQ